MHGTGNPTAAYDVTIGPQATAIGSAPGLYVAAPPSQSGVTALLLILWHLKSLRRSDPEAQGIRSKSSGATPLYTITININIERRCGP